FGFRRQVSRWPKGHFYRTLPLSEREPLGADAAHKPGIEHEIASLPLDNELTLHHSSLLLVSWRCVLVSKFGYAVGHLPGRRARRHRTRTFVVDHSTTSSGFVKRRRAARRAHAFCCVWPWERRRPAGRAGARRAARPAHGRHPPARGRRAQGPARPAGERISPWWASAPSAPTTLVPVSVVSWTPRRGPGGAQRDDRQERGGAFPPAPTFHCRGSAERRAVPGAARTQRRGDRALARRRHDPLRHSLDEPPAGLPDRGPGRAQRL